MDSDAQNCDQVLAAIASAMHANRPANLSVSLYEHLSTCTRCRTGVVLLLSGFAPESGRTETDEACASCQADLAAFIDHEAKNPALAAATYPHVWWHLWTCPTCSQTYRFTRTLLDAHQSGELPSLRLPKTTTQPARVSHQVRLSRRTLQLALPIRASRSVVMRGSSDRYVIFDDPDREPEKRQFTIIVQEQDDGHWQMIVTKKPPLDGLLVLTSGDLRLVAPFTPDGTAIIDNINSEVLLHPNNPDIEIGIVVTEEL